MALSVNYFGDEEKARSHRAEAMNLLYKIQNKRALGQINDLKSPVYTLEDGTTIRIMSVYDKDTVFIESPFVNPEEEKNRIEIATQQLVYAGYHFLASSGDGDLYHVNRGSGVINYHSGDEQPYHQYMEYYAVDSFNGEMYTTGILFNDSYNANWMVEKWVGSKRSWRREYTGGYSYALAVDKTGVYVVGGTLTGIVLTHTRIEKLSRKTGAVEKVVSLRNPALTGDGTEVALSCALDDEYLYVGELCSEPVLGTKQARLLKVSKTDLAYTVAFSDSIIPNVVYESMGRMDVTTKSKIGKGADSVYMTTSRFIKNLSGTTIASFQTGLHDAKVFVTKDFIFSLRANDYDPTGVDSRYKLVCYDFNGTVKWTQLIADGFVAGVGYGPREAGICADKRRVYVATTYWDINYTYYLSLREAFDAKTGDVQWKTSMSSTVGSRYLRDCCLIVPRKIEIES